MVCLGNICRSPLAEGILKSKVNPDHVEVDSAGTAGYHIGEPPDERSISIAQEYGIDISGQRCRTFQANDFQLFDCIYAMDEANLAHILAKAQSGDDRKKVKLLLEEVSLGIREVPDPYYGGKKGFEEVFHLINLACEAICQNLEHQNNRS